MKMDVKNVLKAINELPRESKIELAKTILKPIQPREGETFDISEAFKIAMQLPLPYKYPISRCLVELEQMLPEGQVSKDDIANIAGILLWLTQDHDEHQGMGLKVAYDFIMETDLQGKLNQVAA